MAKTPPLRKVVKKSAKKTTTPERASIPRKKKKSKSKEIQKPLLSEMLKEAQDNVDTQNSEGWGPHLIINARAGTGKTWTQINGLEYARSGVIPKGVRPSPQQLAVWDAMAKGRKPKHVLMCSFGADIAAEIKHKVPDWVQASTLHSAGFRVVRKVFGRVQVNRYKVDNILEHLGWTKERCKIEEKDDLIKTVKNLVRYCKQSLKEPTKGNLMMLAARFDVDPESLSKEVIELVPQVMELCAEQTTVVDYDDMIWFPVHLGLKFRKYDWIIVDECQDLNPCQQALALLMGHRVIMTGDHYQAIFGFAGADTKSMQTMYARLKKTKLGCKQLYLTVSFRCPQVIVDEVKHIVADFEAHKDNPKGSIRRESSQNYFKLLRGGDMVICRCNAPLISHCLRMIKMGQKAYIRGRSIADQLGALILNTRTEDVGHLLPAVEEWRTKNLQFEEAKKHPDEERLIMINDKADCVIAFAEGMALDTSVTKVLEKINEVFSDETKPGVQYTSAHKSKGLEADNVFILTTKGSPMPHPMAKQEWAMEQEQFLIYVARTRAMQTLTYVTGSEK